MQSTPRTTSVPPIPVPDIDSDTPVAVITTASVAPLDGPPDGERINTFMLAPKKNDFAFDDALGALRGRVLAKPLACMGGAFLMGFLISRVLR